MTSHTSNSIESAISPTKRWTVQRIVFTISGLFIFAILAAFVLGLIFAFSDALDTTAARTGYLRDILLVTLTVEGILIIGALATLITQTSRMINMLKKEVRPVIASVQETANLTKTTAEFVGHNLTEPIVRTGAFAYGVRVLIRDLAGIRRAIRHSSKEQNPD